MSRRRYKYEIVSNGAQRTCTETRDGSLTNVGLNLTGSKMNHEGFLVRGFGTFCQGRYNSTVPPRGKGEGVFHGQFKLWEGRHVKSSKTLGRKKYWRKVRRDHEDRQIGGMQNGPKVAEICG